ncbi:hypothetical protein DIPPA_08663 [Diplonema papillatum]|nr:hypothetical protein DIPPA_08663 [Diplonema papillatum]
MGRVQIRAPIPARRVGAGVGLVAQSNRATEQKADICAQTAVWAPETASDGISVRQGNTVAYVVQDIAAPSHAAPAGQERWRSIQTPAASHAMVTKVCWTLTNTGPKDPPPLKTTGSCARAGQSRNVAVGVVPAGPWLLTAMGSDQPPWARPWLAPGWGLVWAPDGSVFELGPSASSSPTYATPKWMPHDVLSIILDKPGGGVRLLINNEPAFATTHHHPAAALQQSAFCYFNKDSAAVLTLLNQLQTERHFLSHPGKLCLHRSTDDVSDELDPRHAAKKPLLSFTFRTADAWKKRTQLEATVNLALSPGDKETSLAKPLCRSLTDNTHEDNDASLPRSAVEPSENTESSRICSPGTPVLSQPGAYDPLHHCEATLPPVGRSLALPVCSRCRLGLLEPASSEARDPRQKQPMHLTPGRLIPSGVASGFLHTEGHTLGSLDAAVRPSSNEPSGRLDLREARRLYRHWALSWYHYAERSVSPAVWAETVLQQLRTALDEAGAGSSALATATACLVLHRICPVFTGFSKAMGESLSLLYPAIFQDFEQLVQGAGTAPSPKPNSSSRAKSADQARGDGSKARTAEPVNYCASHEEDGGTPSNQTKQPGWSSEDVLGAEGRYAFYEQMRDRRGGLMHGVMASDRQLTPVFIALRPWSEKAEQAAAGLRERTDELQGIRRELQEQERAGRRHLKAPSDDLREWTSEELFAYVRMLERQNTTLTRQVLRSHFNAWKRVNATNWADGVGWWDDVLQKARSKALVARSFSLWKRRFRIRRDARHASRLKEAMEVSVEEERTAAKQVLLKVVDTSAGWEALAKAKEEASVGDNPVQDDALEVASEVIEALDVSKALSRWVEIVQVTAGRPRVCTAIDFREDFQDGSVLYNICASIVPSFENLGKHVISALGEYFRHDPLPTVIYNTTYLASGNKAMNILCISALFQQWLDASRAATAEQGEEQAVACSAAPEKVFFRDSLAAFATAIGVPANGGVWTLVVEKVRMFCLHALVTHRADCVHPCFVALLSNHGEGALKKALMARDVMRVLGDERVQSLVKAVFRFSAVDDDQITLREFKQLLEAVGWFDTAITSTDMHLVFQLCQGGGSSSPDDPPGADGDASIDAGEFVDAFGILSAFFPDNPEQGCTVAEHIRWFFAERFFPRVSETLGISAG